MRRERVFERDGYRCVYCGEVFPADDLTVDHVQARVRGGDRSRGNLVTACMGCNTLKGRRRLAEFLRAEPRARANFFRLARHVWRRHLRAVAEEMEERDEGRGRGPAEGGRVDE
jgi:5-methylcytosine-specific restriction endonuclease McrA